MSAANVIGASISSSSDFVKVAPNFTIPNFDKLVTGAMAASRVGIVIWSPLINNETQRKEWEAYADHQLNSTVASAKPCYACGSSNLSVGFSDQKVVFPTGTYTCGDLDYVGLEGLIPPADCPLLVSYTRANCGCRPITKADVQGITVPRSRSNRIFEATNHEFGSNVTAPVEGPGPYSPIWQVNPSGYSNSLTMYDFLTDKYVRGAIVAMLDTQKTIISVIDYYDDYDSLLVSPVFENLSDTNSKVMGTIAFFIRWGTFLEGIAPLGSQGMTLVLENSCGQTKTFKSTGDNVVSVGSGDLHDSAFSSMMEQTSYDDYFTTQAAASTYSNANDSRLNCGYRLSVYASEDFRSQYTTHKPRMYALVISLIFVFTSLLFITYDCYVTQRQRKVMKAALQRDEIVSSLFPAAVRARLFNAPRATRRGSMSSLTTFFHPPVTKPRCRTLLTHPRFLGQALPYQEQNPLPTSFPVLPWFLPTYRALQHGVPSASQLKCFNS